jgi:acetylglutamate kinase
VSRLVVIKVGGNIFESKVLEHVARDVAAISSRGDRVIVVHGGGPQSTAMQKRLGLSPNIVAGRRITDASTLDVMKMVVGGKLNIDMCAALLAAGARPVGLHGASSNAVLATKRPPRVVSGGGPDPIDFGLVGDVEGVNSELFELLTNAGHVPVIACLGADEAGTVLNINADVIANQLSAALRANDLVLVTGTPGVLRDVNDPESRIPTLTVEQAHAAIRDGIVAGGMIPKLEESIAGLTSGKIGSVHIVGSLGPQDLLKEIDEPGAVGTALLP